MPYRCRRPLALAAAALFSVSPQCSVAGWFGSEQEEKQELGLVDGCEPGGCLAPGIPVRTAEGDGWINSQAPEKRILTITPSMAARGIQIPDVFLGSHFTIEEFKNNFGGTQEWEESPVATGENSWVVDLDVGGQVTMDGDELQALAPDISGKDTGNYYDENAVDDPEDNFLTGFEKREALETGTEMFGVWRKDYDPNNKKHYWYNTETGASQWEHPGGEQEDANQDFMGIDNPFKQKGQKQKDKKGKNKKNKNKKKKKM